jgi:hypothetical protein
MRTVRLTSVGLALALLSGCGGGGSSPKPQSTTGAAQNGGGPAALSAEAQSAATGDIPDNQAFLTFRDPSAGYTISYPEGWAQRGSGNDVTIQDKNNVIHIAVSQRAAPTPATVTSELARERQSQPSLTYGPASTVTLGGGPAVKISYSTLSSPNPVTGKRVQLLVDRYVTSHAGKVATLDLGTPKGVDNLDAYKLISRSFKWR